MKKILFYSALAFGLMLSPQLFAQQGIGTNQPNRSSALDIVSTKRGLLIPRFGIPDLAEAAPVTNPANALLVFNNGTAGTPQGFYWWRESTTSWVPLASEGGDPGDPVNVQINGKDPINVSNLGENNFEVSLGLGEDGQVLVTTLDEDSGELVAVWKDPSEIFTPGEVGEITAHNGLSIVDGAVVLGGTLDEPTIINTDGNDLAITGLTEEDDLVNYKVVVMDENGVLHLTDPANLGGDGGPVVGQNLILEDGILGFLDGTDGIGAVLEETKIGIQASTNEGYVLTTIDDGEGGFTVNWANPADIDASEIGASNGLHIESDEVLLGGTLTEETIIETSDENTLAITELQAADDPNKIVVVEDDGVLRTVTRSLDADVGNSYAVSTDLLEYSPYVQEIILNVAIGGLSGGDITITLPAATNASGQVINVKLSEGDEADYYLNIMEGTNVLTYGALPHQAWIFKSNGTNWQLIAKN